jgi:hypothetical protein
MIVAIAASVWALVLVLVVGICAAARSGDSASVDRAELEPAPHEAAYDLERAA